MEPEGSLPHSQVPTTCPYPEPARSNPDSQTPFPEDPSEYYPPIYPWVSPVVSFLQVSPPKPCIRLPSPQYALHDPPISFFSILSPEQHSVSSTDHYAAPLPPDTSSLLGPNIPLNTQLSHTLSLRSSLSVSDHVQHLIRSLVPSRHSDTQCSPCRPAHTACTL